MRKAKTAKERAAKERSRRESYLGLYPWLQGKGAVGVGPLEARRMHRLADDEKYRVAQNKATVRPEHKVVSNTAFEQNPFREQVINDNVSHGRASKDPEMCYPIAELDLCSLKPQSSGAKRRGGGFVDTAEQGGRREATLRVSAISEAARQETVKQEWLGYLFQEQSFAKHKAAMEKAVREHNEEESIMKQKVAEAEVRHCNVREEEAPKHEIPMTEDPSYKSMVVAVEEVAVDDDDPQKRTARDSESASHGTERTKIVENTFMEKAVKEKGKEKMIEDTNQVATSENTAKHNFTWEGCKHRGYT